MKFREKKLTPCVKPIRGEKHGEKQDNEGIVSDGDPESVYFYFPGRVARSGNLGAICADNVLRVNHNHRNRSAT
jgi:hypothetical protein